jgi:hypothetical protein
MSADWANVQPEVAKTTRVCAYDRAGTGWSEPGPELSSAPTAPFGVVISCRASSARRRARRRLPTQTNVSSGLRNHTDVRTALDF